jgi:hypothetical protein
MSRRLAFEVHGPGWYDAKQAARLSGHSFAMLNYLCRHHLVEPSCDCKRGSGSARHYCFGDLVVLRLMAKLSATGISPLRLKKGMQYFKRVQPAIQFAALPGSHLVSDGEYVYLRNGNDMLERATDGQYSFAFVLELDSLRREVIDMMTPVELMLAV